MTEVNAAELRRLKRRERIVATARELFLAEGYHAASMSAVAAALGGSKGTLYNYFISKEDLFAAVVEADCEEIRRDALPILSDLTAPIADVLARVGEAILVQLHKDRRLALYRVVVAEAVRTPEIARRFYEVGPRFGGDRLAEYLQRAHDAGFIQTPDPRAAADHFISLCRGDRYFRRVLNLESLPSRADLRRDAEAATAIFLGGLAAAAEPTAPKKQSPEIIPPPLLIKNPAPFSAN
jgi:AcrR family transcriptional regulator